MSVSPYEPGHEVTLQSDDRKDRMAIRLQTRIISDPDHAVWVCVEPRGGDGILKLNRQTVYELIETLFTLLDERNQYEANE